MSATVREQKGLPTPLILVLAFFGTAAVVLLLWAILPRPAPNSRARHYQEDFPDDPAGDDTVTSVDRELGVSDQPVPPARRN